MAGTSEGAKRAVKVYKEKYGEDFYRELGRKGGKRCVSKGFGKNRELAESAGKKGALKRWGKEE